MKRKEKRKWLKNLRVCGGCSAGVLSAVMLATLVPSTAFAIGRTDTGSFLTGPYLMTPKTNGMVVVWELDKPMKSTITYGTSDADKKTLEVPVEEGEKFRGESMHMYRARLTDLTPGNDLYLQGCDRGRTDCGGSLPHAARKFG